MCDFHGQLYNHTAETQLLSMDKWESDLANYIFSKKKLRYIYKHSFRMEFKVPQA